jgi:hypothetical protein
LVSKDVQPAWLDPHAREIEQSPDQTVGRTNSEPCAKVTRVDAPPMGEYVRWAERLV